MIGRRRPAAVGVLPHSGFGLGLPTVTALPTRQWARPAARVVQVVPIDWRPQGPQLTFGVAVAEPGQGATTPCEEC